MGATWLAGAGVFFRAQVSSGFHTLMGNDGDARLVAYLCEHWFRVWHGQDSWRSPAFFYPVKGLLGWSDTFLLYQVFYAPLRLLGFDPFESLQLTIVLLSLVGFVSMVCLVRLAFGTPRPVAGICGLIFVFANNLWLHEGFPQLSGVYLVPLILLVGLLAWRAAATSPVRSAILGTGFGLLWALLFFTTYYVAWFATLGAGVAIVIWLLVSRGRLLTRIYPVLKAAWRPAVGAAVAFSVGIVPFAVTYLPVRHDAGVTYQRVLATYTGRLRDVANVGPGNVWSSLVRATVPTISLSSVELSYAVTPLMLLLAVAGAVVGIWRLGTKSAARPAAARAAGLLGLTAVVLCVLPLRTRFGTPWRYIWHLPGASAIRAIDRLQIVTGAVVILAVAAAASEVSAYHSTRRRPVGLQALGMGLLVLALAEQFNVTTVSVLNDRAQVALLDTVTRPPAACRSFYVTDSLRPTQRFFEYQVDAMLISQKVSMPTLNGYTGYNPTGWGLENPGVTGYQSEVATWVVDNGIPVGLCRLDIGTMKWYQNPLVVSTSVRSKP